MKENYKSNIKIPAMELIKEVARLQLVGDVKKGNIKKFEFITAQLATLASPTKESAKETINLGRDPLKYIMDHISEEQAEKINSAMRNIESKL